MVCCFSVVFFACNCLAFFFPHLKTMKFKVDGSSINCFRWFWSRLGICCKISRGKG